MFIMSKDHNKPKPPLFSPDAVKVLQCTFGLGFVTLLIFIIMYIIKHL